MVRQDCRDRPPTAFAADRAGSWRQRVGRRRSDGTFHAGRQSVDILGPRLEQHPECGNLRPGRLVCELVFGAAKAMCRQQPAGTRRRRRVGAVVGRRVPTPCVVAPARLEVSRRDQAAAAFSGPPTCCWRARVLRQSAC
eukprot:1023474-Rhodomonas_salina.4